jgi:methylamine---glutamate N-methyltransferase subunit A
MCGIVGLLLKRRDWDGRLGHLLVPMLVGMTDRGPDSAGLAVYTAADGDRGKLSVFDPAGEIIWEDVLAALRTAGFADVRLQANGAHAIFSTAGDLDPLRQHLRSHWPRLAPLSAGRSIDLYKDVGTPGAICARYGFDTLTGTHAVGHTRMATESAVTPAHAHPFTAGRDFCLVHNGSLSNPHLVRRKLEPLGIRFETDNDTEAACRFLEWRMREGDSIEEAIRQGFVELDGFFTFLIGTADGLALVRDPFACKPAIVAETDDYVAIASEFRSLAHLPGVDQAQLFEPQPGRIYSWRRA